MIAFHSADRPGHRGQPDRGDGERAGDRVELDGAQTGRIEGPPWITKVDLGAALRPHELVARALDAHGREIARASQWLNLPRPHAEAEIVLEHGADGVPNAAAALVGATAAPGFAIFRKRGLTGRAGLGEARHDPFDGGLAIDLVFQIIPPDRHDDLRRPADASVVAPLAVAVVAVTRI